MKDLPQIKGLKDLPADHLMAPGTAMCAGCGGLEVIHEIYDVLGERTVFVNAAGCMTMLAVYPYTPFKSPWFFTSMASAAAGAQGVRDALDILIARGRLSADMDHQVLVLAGDGSSYGMGLGATSGAMERNLDFIYLCYDNEGYGNTGHQTSAATPHGATTATHRAAHGVAAEKKSLFDIWVAHRPTYVATVSAADPVDLASKVQKAKSLRGPRLLLALSPCPTGWSFDPSRTMELAKLAIDTGVWPLKEYADGSVRHTRRPKHRERLEAYLRPQGRFRHLFEPERDETTLHEISGRIEEYWKSAP